MKKTVYLYCRYVRISETQSCNSKKKLVAYNFIKLFVAELSLRVHFSSLVNFLTIKSGFVTLSGEAIISQLNSVTILTRIYLGVEHMYHAAQAH